MSENLNKDDRSYVNVLREDCNQVDLQLFVNAICISVQKIRGKIVRFGKCTDSLKVSKIFLSVKGNNKYSENFSWPEVTILTLHTYLSTFLLILVERI